MEELMDTHIHSKYSFDSSAEISEILQSANHSITITDSIVFQHPFTKEDHLFDISAQQKEIQTFQSQSPTKIYSGVECLYTKNSAKKINEATKPHNFDSKILTVISDDCMDFMSDEVVEQNVQQALESYFTTMKEALELTENIQVLSTFDYGFRRFSLPSKTSSLLLTPYLEEIFKILIRKDIALEWNAKSTFLYGYLHIYESAIRLYHSLGGEMITFGSDAKRPSEVEFQFNDNQENLKRLNVKEITEFEKGKPVFTPLT
jgi:histidinol-phosphatase (PHP family)